MGSVRNGKGLLMIAVVLVMTALVPLCGILIPPHADLPQQILVNKLLWEKLSGVSQLDLEISWFLGYRLPSVLIVGLIAVSELANTSLLYLPKAIAVSLISIHAVTVASVFHVELRPQSWSTHITAVCFALPAVVAMYSASWFIGFIGFTLGVTLLVPAVFLTERFVSSGKAVYAAGLFAILILVYAAHPFTLVFWLIWCASRGISSLTLLSVTAEWKQFLVLGLIVLPIFGYQFLATTGLDLTPSPQNAAFRFPFLLANDWYNDRFLRVVEGIYLKADETSEAQIFGVFAAVFLAASVVFAFRSGFGKQFKATALAAIVFVVTASWIDEKFFPVPEGHWLAYDYRFATAALVVCLSFAGVILARSFRIETDKSASRTILAVLAIIAALASVEHLLSVRKAYARFDAPAREYIAKILEHEPPAGLELPRSRWYPGGTHLRRYVCLEQPDCNPAGTLFRNLGGDIYPVKLKSQDRVLPPGAVPVDQTSEPVNSLKGGEGYRGGQFSKPRGLAIASNGDFFVADTGNDRIQKFDAAGNFIFAFGRPGAGEGEFKDPSGVAVDDSGHIYIVDAENQKLLKFAPDGSFVKEWRGPEPGFFGPRDIAAGANGQLYIADQGRARIVNFDVATETFNSWGSFGAEPGQFRGMTGVEAAGGLVYVADLGNNRAQVFDPNGKFIRQWEVEPWGRYVWNYADLALDSGTDRIYLTNGWRKEVLVYDRQGKLIESLKPGAPAELNNASSIAISLVSGSRKLFVLNTGSDAFDAGEPKVSVFDLSASSN